LIDNINEIYNEVTQEVEADWQNIAYDREKREEIVLAIKFFNSKIEYSWGKKISF
jgi:hypothetical protein